MDNYDRFRQLHTLSEPFVLANVCNAKSAQIAQASGFQAVGTSSGAIADSLGYPDGEKIPFDEMFYIVKRIKSVTNVPMSVDMERGYTDDLGKLKHNIQQLLDIGVAGINIEDPQGEDIYLRKLQTIKEYLAQTGQRLFVNARTDVFLQKLDSPIETTIRRADLYRQAGADCLFVTGVQDAETIRIISSATTLPVNVVATPKMTSYELLSRCGVRRISMAAFLYRASYQQEAHIAEDIIQRQNFSSLHPVNSK